MRNKFPGKCYRCGEIVAVGDGHFERFAGGWRTQHAGCAIKYRGTKVEHVVSPGRLLPTTPSQEAPDA